MIERVAADTIVVLHLAFIAFVVLGGMLAWRDLRFAWVHLPAVAWGAFAELTGSICPLTPLENALRARAGQVGYEGGFVEQYLIPINYPAGLTPAHQRWIGVFVIAVNVAVYAAAMAIARRRAAGGRESA
jgi:hypothetical protein